MTTHQIEVLAELMEVSPDHIRNTDAKVKRYGYEDLPHYMMGCLIQLMTFHRPEDLYETNKRFEAVWAKAKKLVLEEN